jgi:murein DD-endopeptidase MepM/ murein hydrolase activator NlpD
MIRILALATGVLIVGGTATAGGTAMQSLRAVLDSPVAPGAPGVTVDDGAHGAAVLHAPAGTPLFAVISGALTRPAALTVRLQGAGDDVGLTADYAAVAVPTDAPVAERGDLIARVATPASAVAIRVTLDGRPVDAAALLRAALSGSMDGAGDWTRPVEGATVSQPFGCSRYTFEPADRNCLTGHMHTGIDLAVPLGTPVRAALPGVVHVVVSPVGYGLHVIVDDEDGLTTLYAHLDSVAVREGDEVDAGDLLGRAGSTGNSTGPHLHFEVRRDGVPEDPTLDVALP